MRKKLYLSIIDQLRLIQQDDQGKYITALTLDDKKSVIKHLDIWNNNLQYIEQEVPFPTPALFLQFQPITWEIRSKGLRAADVAVTLHVVTSNIAPSNHKSQYETKAFEFLDLLDAINANLYGLKGDFFRNLVSTTSSTDHDHAELIDSLETYNVQVTDTSAVKVLPTTYVAPVVTTGFING